MYWDQHLLHVEVIRTFAKVGPNTEPKFRDECKILFLLLLITILFLNIKTFLLVFFSIVE